MCIQTYQPTPGESEDCLYLDVYKPQGFSTPLPVMVWIHGGGNVNGNKNKFNGTLLAARGVIVVTTNYRLGPFGFLSTEDATMPGNYGMLDQIAALQWVQDNIAAFGGDPTSVTLFGESAGSADVSLHVLSPLSKGLFARAIMQSGCSSTSRAVPPPLVGVTPNMIVTGAGAILGCNQTGHSFLSCLQSKDAHALYQASIKASRSDVSTMKFRPRVENVFGFLPDYPLRLLYRGAFNKIDTLRGFNAQEKGDLRPVGDPDNDGLTIVEFRTLATKVLNDFPYVYHDKYMKLIEDLYLANVTNPFEIRSKAIQMTSDFSFIAPVVLEAKTAKPNNQDSKYFLYQFNYQPSYNHKPHWMGTLHAFDIQFVFGFPQRLTDNWHPKPNAADLKVSDMMMTMWTNFAKFGNPTPAGHSHAPLIHWSQFYYSKRNYLQISEHLEHREFNTTQNTKVLDLYRETETDYILALTPSLPVVG